jgi:hypothetical protein
MDIILYSIIMPSEDLEAMMKQFMNEFEELNMKMKALQEKRREKWMRDFQADGGVEIDLDTIVPEKPKVVRKKRVAAKKE